ncbi:CoA transferase [Salicibibacter cibarius]|uniref:CoA transferase n=1 Tax=Salicibibacter cibarius TaxID=2743000 RepID=A0A7T7CDA0_9BACI|nr:CaiB/BaiF CoA-transferase family protein [Salicibibacter cibarius]QQK77777.1 CoA transferase [Salicibibacter cibarius]
MLNGVKVLSFTHFLQGPAAVQMLADVGADVIKIEPPKGSFERHWAGADTYKNGVSFFHLLGNRNQRSLSIDLQTDEGKEICYRLIQDADVLIENYRPGVMDKLGFSYKTLKQKNSKLIYCSCTGYGSDGPYKDRPGQDLLLQALGGLTFLTGDHKSPPTPVGTAIVDQHSAVLAAFGVVAALVERERTGEGKKVDVNLLNSAIDLQIEPFTYYLNKGSLWERTKTNLATQFHPAPYGVYGTLDGWLALSFTPIDKLTKVFNNDALKPYSQNDQSTYREKINQIIVQELKKKTTDDWMKVFSENGIWYAPVNDYKQVENDPQIKWNKVIEEIEHPDAGEIKILNHPINYNGESPAVRQYPPRLGEHTGQILEENGYSNKEIKELQQKNVVFTHKQ